MSEITIPPGETSSGIILDFDEWLYVGSKSVVDDTIVNSSSFLFVCPEGSANNTTVNSGGYLVIYYDGVANSTTVSSGGSIFISGRGAANDTTLSGGYLAIQSDGTATNINVDNGGYLIISNGGRATEVIENGGNVVVEDGASVQFVTHTISGLELSSNEFATVHSGTTANGAVVKEGGRLILFSGGMADDATVDSKGDFYISSGGTATNAIVNLGGKVTVSYGGTANSTTVSGGAVTVFYGGTANKTTVLGGAVSVSYAGTANSTTVSGGGVNVSESGTANDTTLNGGILRIESGGMASNTTVNSGSFVVSKGGSASNTTINGGFFSVVSSGTVSDTTVNGGGMNISYGGTATGIVENGGYVDIKYGAKVTFVSNTISGRDISGRNATVHSCTTVKDTTVTNGGITVFYGGIAENVTFHVGGGLNVSSGGTATGIIENGGNVAFEDGATVEFASNTFSGAEINTIATIHSGTTANAASVNQYGSLTVFSGGSASGASVNANGSMVVTSGGTATEIMENGGYVEFEDGASVTFARHTFSGIEIIHTVATVHSGTTAKDAAVLDYSLLNVFSGGSADGVRVDACGALIISSGGAAVNLIENGGCVKIEDGATATFQANTFSGMELYGEEEGVNNTVTVHSGTTAVSTTLESYSLLEVFSGGVAEETIIIGGTLKAHSGCVLKNTTLDRGTLSIIGGTLSGFVNSNGRIDVSDGGVIGNIKLSGGQEYSYDEDGYIWHLPSLGISSGGTATAITADDGRVFVSSGGVVSDIAIGATYYDFRPSTGDGYYYDFEGTRYWFANPGIHLSAGGKLTGQMTFNSGAKVFAATGSIIDFDLTQAAAGGSALLNDITLVEGTPNYTLTIDGTQENGTYRLAGGFGLGSVFSSMISVLNTSGNQLGILMVGQTFSYGNTEYTLGVADGCLSVTVQGAEVTPDPGDVDAPTAPTGLDAVVSGQKVALVWNAGTDDSSGVKEYVVTYTLNEQVFTARTSNTNYVLTGANFGSYSWSVQTVDFAGNESAVAEGEGFSVTATPVSPDPGPEIVSAAKGDIDGNGVSDVMFQWTGGDNQIGFWMNGHTQWQSQSRTHSPEWTVLGARDMNGDGKADTLMLGQASIIDMQGTYIGYYSGGVDTDANWHTIGFLLNQGPSNNVAWNNAVGNLTGNANANSIVWYSPNLYALGIWTDGTDNWKSLSYEFGGDAWTLVGCGDFDGDGKDSVLMTYNNGQLFYAVGIDGSPAALGAANWSGWEVRAIGDFAGDGRDDLVLFHHDTGSMVMCADGNVDSYTSIGQLAADDWFVVGAGDYNGDAKDDLLVRQYSTGMLGYYVSGDTAQWVEMGRGVDMNWTVIA